MDESFSTHLPLGHVETRYCTLQFLDIFLRRIRPCSSHPGPKFLSEPCLVGISVLADDGCDSFGTLESKPVGYFLRCKLRLSGLTGDTPVPYWGSVVKNIHSKLLDSKRIEEFSHRLR